MQPYPKASRLSQLLDTPTRTCKHTYLRQTTHPSLPPLYVSTGLRGPTTSSLPRSTITYLQQSLNFLGCLKPRSPFVGRDIVVLRKELERGMDRDRREQMRCFVTGLKDEEQRRVAEMYLARYPGFVLDGEGKLDYGVGDRFVVEDKIEEGKNSCVVM